MTSLSTYSPSRSVVPVKSSCMSPRGESIRTFHYRTITSPLPSAVGPGSVILVTHWCEIPVRLTVQRAKADRAHTADPLLRTIRGSAGWSRNTALATSAREGAAQIPGGSGSSSAARGSAGEVVAWCTDKRLRGLLARGAACPAAGHRHLERER